MNVNPESAIPEPSAVIRLGTGLPGPQGFALHSDTRLHRPCLLSTTRDSATLCSLAASGSPTRLGFLTPATTLDVKAVGLPWVSRASSPYPVQLHHKKVTPDIGSRSATPARPPSHGHIAGSLFATHTASASCFLQTSISRTALALLALPFRPVTVGVLLPPPFSV